MWLLWIVWTQSSELPQQEKQPEKGFKGQVQKKETQKPKKDIKGKGKTDMTNIRCYNRGELGHFAWDCPMPRKMLILLEKMSKTGKLLR